MKKWFCILSIFLCLSAGAQGWTVGWGVSARMSATSGEYMPFWSRTGDDGILPLRSSALAHGTADVRYDGTKGLFFEAGTSLAAAATAEDPIYKKSAYAIVDRLYVSGGWKMLRADIGMLPRRGDLGPLSVTGGDMMFSGNARNMPGINLSSDWIYPVRGKWFGFKGNLAHYQMIDNRKMMGAMIHNKSAAAKLSLGPNIDLMGGLGHICQWGGYNQHTMERQPQSFEDFVRVFFAKRGGESASMSDQMNALGNHLGNEWMRIVYKANRFSVTLQYDKTFEDNSGKNFQNAPDGVWTLQLSSKDRQAFVTDVIYELITTTWQSGPYHDRPATEEEMAAQDKDDPYYGKIVLGGMDNYFNNSPYQSGWTHYGRTIGLPLFIPSAPGPDGYCLGIINNRLRGHHLGIQGVVKNIPYRFKATFTRNYGRYTQSETSNSLHVPSNFHWLWRLI